MSGMLRQPSQSDTVSRLVTVISGLTKAINDRQSSSSSRSGSADSSRRADGRRSTKIRRLACTCGAASPTPWYSFIVSSMSSTSCWTFGVLMSEGCSGRARARSTGCPIRATFRIAIGPDYIGLRNAARRPAPGRRFRAPRPPLAMHESYRFCVACGGPLALKTLKETEPQRLVCSVCSFVFYLDPKVAVGTIIRTGDDRLVLVRRAIEPGYGLWVFPGGYVDRGEELTAAAIREAREECGLDVRVDGLINIYSYPQRPMVIVVYAASVLGGELCSDDECLEAKLFSSDEIPWDHLAFRSTHEALRDYLAGRVQPIR